MSTAKREKTIGIHLDVGHASIGWAVSSWDKAGRLLFPGTGSLLFPADDCLASQRRMFRRQRRHVRSIRQRIARLGAYLTAEGVIKAEELRSNFTASPWKLAARVLSGGKLLTWPELWAVLRWYAHNRGYDGNVLWSGRTRVEAEGGEEGKEDTEANENAHAMMRQYGKSTMAETFCAALGVDPQGELSSGMFYFKGQKVSFNRALVREEVIAILQVHLDKLPGLTPTMIEVITADPVTQPEYLREAHPAHVPPVHQRYLGGLLFGQLAPRFDNRIIGVCPVTGKKLPSKASKEFLDFRWAMMLSNVRVGPENRPLSIEEIGKLNDHSLKQGGFTKGDFRKAIAEITGLPDKMSNLDALLLTPDAEKSLVRFPGLFALTKKIPGVQAAFEPKTFRVICNKLFHGKALSYRDLQSSALPGKHSLVVPLPPKKGKPATPLSVRITAEIPVGRAPYARDVLDKAAREVFEGKDPRAKGGILYRDATKADVLPLDKLDAETNNHLIRNRIRVLLKLMRDIIHDYAESNPARVTDVTIEMARDIKDLSGMTNKEIESDLSLRTAEHRKVAEKIAADLGIDARHVSAGLIRKGRIAEDMGYICPYTGMPYDIKDVQSKGVDLDHILPYSQRVSDSLDSLVLTYSEVNRMKGNRTALQFIRECGGQRVPGKENLVILQEAAYKKLVNSLSTKGWHADDSRRRKSRIEKLLQLTAKESGMTQGLLTQTSYITALAVKAIRGFFGAAGSSRIPAIHTVQGRITAEVRMQWNILSTLGKIDPRVLDENGELRLKSEIRDITHMHHAVDAITIGLTAMLLPPDGNIQALMLKRHLTEADKAVLRSTGLFCFSEDQARLRPLPDATLDSIKAALSEQRAIFYQPHSMSGLGVDQNTWGVEAVEDGKVTIHQRKRIDDPRKYHRNELGQEIRIEVKRDTVPVESVFGLVPVNGNGKLQTVKGVLPFSDNFAAALMGDGPILLRLCHVKKQREELKKRNGGRPPELVRRGAIISVKTGTYPGIWRIASIKGNKGGLCFDMARPYFVKLANKTSGVVINARVSTMVKGGLAVLHPRLTGVPSCPITSSTSPKQAAD